MLTGSISQGTLRDEDLLPRFVDAIDEILNDRITDTRRDSPEEVAEVGRIHDFLGDWERRSASEDYWDGEEVGWDLDKVFDILDTLAPDGFYFGAHEGDGADFGFWPLPEEEDSVGSYAAWPPEVNGPPGD